MQKSTLRVFLRRNKLFALLLAVELAVTAALVVGLFGEPYRLKITGADFQNEYPQLAAMDEDGTTLKIYNEIDYENYDGSAISFSTDGLALSSGAYEVEVSYFSCQTPDNPTFNRERCAGTMSFSSAKYPSAITVDSIALDDGHRTVTGRLWVGFASRMSDLTVSVTYAEGQLYLYSVTLTEQPIYRATRLAAFLLIALFADFVLWLVFAHVGAEGVRRRRALRLPLAVVGIALVGSLGVIADRQLGGHDLEFHFQRIANLGIELSYGQQFLVRIVTAALNGYGYAESLCYCDLFLVPFALLYNAYVPLRTCYALYVFAITLLTAVIAYGCFARILKSRKYALLGTMLYTLSAYRLVNVYIRSALGEYTAMAFLPLVLLGLYEMYTTEKPRFAQWSPMALGMAALVQCHLLTVELTVFLLVVFCALRLRKTLRPARLLAWVKAALLAVGLSAWFFFPLMISTSTIPFMVNGSIIGKIQSDGLYLMQLLSPFGPGMGDSLVGYSSDMTVTLGLPLLIGLGMVLYCMARREQWEDERTSKLLYTVTGYTAFTILLTLEIFPWDAVHTWLGRSAGKLVGLFQFPWRFLVFASLLLTMAVLLALRLIAQRDARAGRILAAMLTCSALLYAGVATMQAYSQEGESGVNSVTRSLGSAIGVGEYLIDGTSAYETVWAQPKPGSEALTLTNWEQHDGKSYLSVENTGEAALINVPVFNYGNYHAVDENGTEFEITSGKNERIVLQIPADYTGTITIWYQEPTYWHVFELISALTLLGTVWYAIHTRKNALPPQNGGKKLPDAS